MKTCTRCGTFIPIDTPEGLCARCLLSVAMNDDPGVTVDPDAIPSSAGESPAATIDIGDPAEVARRLPQFEILELLGRGGMGVVYKARQNQLDRLVALKILPPTEATSPDFIERFRREARSLAKLSHPNIVSVYDFGESNGLYYFVMEFVDGLNLRQTILAKRLTPAEALAVVPPICGALQFAHEEGVVHRDIKPENILIDRKGRVKIADFGLAKVLGRKEADPRLTVSGATLGTPRYMAPEQVEKPESVDHRADIYSLGVVFYEMLTGELPMGRFAPPSHKVQIDVRLDEIVLHALERDVELRYQHASDMKTEVEIVSNTPSIGRSPQPTRRGKAWPAWVWWTLLALIPLPFMQVAELNRGEELARHGPKYGFPGEIRLALLALGAMALFKLVELRRAKVSPTPDVPFAQPWLGIIAVLFGACVIAVGPFPHVEWLRQTLQVTPQKVANAAGTTVELAAFSQTIVTHGWDFGEGKAIAAISVLAGAIILLAPRGLRWNVARSIVLLVAAFAIIFQLVKFDLHHPQSFAGSTEFVESSAITDPIYRQFRDDYRRAEAADAATKNVPPEMLGAGVFEQLEKPNSRETYFKLLQRQIASNRGFFCQSIEADGGSVCAYAAVALFVLGIMTLRQTMRFSAPAFAGFFHFANTWGGMLLLVPCLISALFAAWVENNAWIPPGAVNPVIIDVPDHRVYPIGVEFWQGRVIAAVCVVAILVLGAVAFKILKPGVRVAALTVAGLMSITLSVSFMQGQMRPTTVSWHDLLAVAKLGATAPNSLELRQILTERPQFVAQLATLQKNAQALAAKLPSDSPEARKLANGPDVIIYQNPGNAELCTICGLGLLLLGIRDGYLLWRKRREQLPSTHDPQSLAAGAAV